MRSFTVLVGLAAAACGHAKAAPVTSSPVSSSPAAAPNPAHGVSRFRAWIVERAAGEGLVVDAWWEDDLDRDGALDRVAKLCRPNSSEQAWYVVETSGGDHFVAEHASWGFSSVCPDEPRASSDASLPWRTRATGSIVLAQSGKRGDLEERHLAVRDRALVTVFEVGGGAEHPHGWGGPTHVLRTEIDWERGVRFRRREPLDADGFWARDEAAAIVPVRVAGARSSTGPPTWFEVTDGRAWWRGPKDASLSLVAETRKRGIAVRIAIIDDHALPVADSADLSGRDHDVLALWWCVPETPEACTEDAPGLRSMLVAFDVDGEPVTRSAFPSSGQGTPPVRRVGGGVIELMFELPAGIRTIDFAAELRDRDGRGDDTTVATARVHHGDLASLGALVVLEGGGRWPLAGRPLGATDTIIAPQQIE
jgi:hypothetical protein